MRSLCLLVTLLLASAGGCLAASREISVGATKVVVPIPQSLMDWTDEKSQRAEFARKAILLPQKLVGFFASTDVTIYVQIQTNTAFEKEPISARDFSQLQEMAESQAAAMMKSGQMQATVDHVNDMLSRVAKDKAGDSAGIKMDRPLLLPIASRSNRHLTMPMLAKILTDVGGKSKEAVLVGTLTFVRVKEKLLYIYLYDQYTNDESKQSLLKKTETYLKDFWALNEAN